MLLLPALPLLLRGILNRRIIQLNNIISILLLITFSSCIRVYTPKIKGSDLNKYVVNGQVTTGTLTQTVNISQTAPISDPSYKPVAGCKVTIQDNEQHNFKMVDLENGSYSTLIPPQYLVPGHVFRINIITPDRDSIVSDYDTLQPVPPIDSIYYHIKTITDRATGKYNPGIQFYLNFKGTNADSRYYRWDVFETWEYHAEYPLQYYYDGTLHHVSPPDYSRYTCWHTRKIPEIFTVTTANLSQNKYDKLKLQHVTSNGLKLVVGYSMLVEQFALSKEAYSFWNQMRINSTQNGGLYEKQPITIRGNLHDITHPGKGVLGFFSAESASSKRIFIRHVPGLTLNYLYICNERGLRYGYRMIPKSAYPAYIKAGRDGLPTSIWLTHGCIDCMILGGDTIKPSFWPN